MNKPFVFVDVETSGMSLRTSRIIEIGMIRVENGKIVGKFQSLVNPKVYLAPEVTRLTGITEEMLQAAPSFREIIEDVIELLDGAILIAHNVAFDYAHIKKELKLLKIPYIPQRLCTVKLSRALFPHEKHHNLDAIIQRHNFSIANRHRAFDDANILVQFLDVLEKHFGKKTLENVIQLIMKTYSLPPLLKKSDLENLPTSPGVYIFYGESGCVLYVGKSINIKERVLSHFYTATTNSVEFQVAQQVTAIEAKQTTGEIGALLLEAKLIKDLQPLYNRKSRRKNSFVVLFGEKTKDGYLTVRKERINALLPKNLSTVLGIFPSLKRANNFLFSIAKTHILCEKLLGLTKDKGSCFSYQLNLCQGACIQKEKKELYNARFKIAFAKTRLHQWPFSRPYIFSEANGYGDTTYHVFDQWCYLGSYFSESEIEESIKSVPYIFDYDVYHIMRKIIKGNNNKLSSE